MPENQRTDRDVIVGAGWDIPVTDTFVAGVRRGLRRRHVLRGAAAGGALLATAGVATFAISLASGGTPAVPAVPPPVSTSVGDRPLDGFRIGTTPRGAVVAGADSWYTAAVTDKGLRNDGPDPRPGEPRASVTMRRYDRGVGVGLFVTVLRPETTTAPVSTEQLGQWLTAWAMKQMRPLKTFDVPAGTAQLFANAGNEATAYEVVITAHDGVVITIGGAATFTAAELEAVARGITP